MKLTLDLETRSKVDLKKCGMHAYAEHPSTDILCIAFKIDNERPFLWVPEKFHHLGRSVPSVADQEVSAAIEKADIIEAHNFGFEACIWHEIMHKRYGFADLPFEKARCSAAKAATYALPRSLDGACKALHLSHQKDNVGYKIMLKMCKPRKPSKNNPAIWHEKPEEFDLLCRYCIQDVEAEHALSEMLYDISESELEVWRLDQIINNRGVRVDLGGINNLISKVQAKEQKLLLEIQELTGGSINSTRQGDATLSWLKGYGVSLPNLTKDTVEKALRKDMPSRAKRILEIRQSLSKSSVSKLKAMKNRASKDGRVKGSLLYHGASTGRWSGKGIQPQNYPRGSYPTKDIINTLELSGEEIEFLYDCVIQTASKCLRGMIKAEEGKELFCADFSSIEARVLAWLAGEKKVIDAFESGLDLYKVTATDIYNTKYEDVTKEQRQIGKTAVLALGYQGWVGAFRSMANVYGIEVEEEKAKEIILAWREANPSIVAFWKNVEDAAIKAVKTHDVFSYGRIKFGIRDNFLHCRLPSDRLLSYYNPSIQKITTKWGQEKEVVSFMGMDSFTNKWTIQYSYGGKLTENIVQAVARDILAEALLRIEKAGYKIVLHIHDEIVAEVEKGTRDLKEFERIMSEVPAWAKGCPIDSEGWQGERYRKA